MLQASRISVLAVDDHPLLREGIASMLGEAGDIHLVAQAANGHEAIELYRLHRPDVTLMDIQMPGMSGIETLIEIRREFPKARLIMLTVYRGETQARDAIKAGASGYLLKSMVQKELRDAIRLVHGGQRYIPAEIAAQLANSMAYEDLSPAEIEVLQLVASGFSNKRVAAALSIPEETVKSRMKSILSKLSANDRTHAVILALKRGIIDVS
ncbi:DNA-binding response regulator [Rhodoferax koreense]|uniref:DNA-binding response regulator n=1 Tax=Rhodoferax koreensis TaxID=1842727 RepID=A0A1P8K4E7_9BURK|nr:DNA-binding response regulator [Rhodoferax koreense]